MEFKVQCIEGHFQISRQQTYRRSSFFNKYKYIYIYIYNVGWMRSKFVYVNSLSMGWIPTPLS